MPDDDVFVQPFPLTEEQLARVGQHFEAIERHYPGVIGCSAEGHGVRGDSGGPGAGVFGLSTSGPGVSGHSQGDQPGVLGRSDVAQGVWGESVAANRCGVAGVGNLGHGVVGETRSPNHAGLTARGPDWAGRFEGRVHVIGDLVADRDVAVAGTVRVGGDVILQGADLAERFRVTEGPCEPGTVMVLTGSESVAACRQAYDPKVAGVVSGAGTYRPALVLHGDLTEGAALAMAGKVWVLADAQSEPIDVGDLLTTSAVLGHARRATDRGRSHGAIIGKALDPLPQGLGLIRALVALH